MEAATQNQALQLLTFTLDGELFGVDIGRVREVLEFRSVTKVPRVPEFMRGVINLRGSVVPVVDLKLKFNIGRTEKTVATCVIITEISMGGENIILGMLADAVQEVIDMDPRDVEPPPRIGTRLDTNYIDGMGKRDGNFIILLNIDRIFTEREIEEVSASS